MNCCRCLERFYLNEIEHTEVNAAITIYGGNALCALDHGIALRKDQLASAVYFDERGHWHQEK